MKRTSFALYRPATFRAAAAMARCLPPPFLRWLARRAADLCWACLPGFRNVVRNNLAHVVPPATLGAAVRRNFRNFAESLADYVCCERINSVAELDKVVIETSGLEHVDAALALKRGVIIVTAHLGSWELGGLLFGLRGYPVWAVTLEEAIDELTDMRENYRTSRGIHTIRMGKSPFSGVSIIHHLQQNHMVAILIDRPPAGSAEMVEFFKTPTRLSAAPAMLAHLTGAVVLPAFVVSIGGGHYRAFIQPPVPMDSGPRAEAVAANTQRLARVFEPVIAQHADQWYQFVPLWNQE